MMKDNLEQKNGSFQQAFAEVKEYVRLQGDYIQLTLLEKLTKLLAKLIFGLLVLLFAVLALFYLLFALAHAIAPHIGFVAAFVIVAALFLLMLLLVVVFKKQLIIDPLLKIMVEVFSDDVKEGSEADENN